MKTPLVPPSARVRVQLNPDERSTWSPNGEKAWTIGPALNHYRCFFPTKK